MRFTALAADYDGTIATDGVVDHTTLEALQALKNTNRRLVLVTGRQLDDLGRAFPHLALFDRVVAENGALVYTPGDGRLERLGEPPPAAFVEALRQRHVDPLSVGDVIVATWEPHQSTVIETIHDFGLELQVIFNKGAVMVLPAGVNKATGLMRALDDLHLSPRNVVGVGDAENDHAFLRICGCAVAVANALPTLKERADWLTTGARGAGVAELIGHIVEHDMRDVVPVVPRHCIPIGRRDDGSDVTMNAHGTMLLIAGASGAGKSTTAMAVLEELVAHKYQFCLIDPEGDFQSFTDAVVLGNEHAAPTIEEIMTALNTPATNVVAGLMGIGLDERPAFFDRVVTKLGELRAKTGRPHWFVIDEAHHLMTRGAIPERGLPPWLDSTMLITLHPNDLPHVVLAAVNRVIGVGAQAPDVIATVAQALARPMSRRADPPPSGRVLYWSATGSGEVKTIEPCKPRGERLRHRRKYAEGALPDERSFYFRGPDHALNLRAQNLTIFLQMAAGVDDGTWDFHLKRGDYSDWIRRAIKDDELAEEVAAVEQATISPAESRQKISEAISRKYTSGSPAAT